MHYITRELEERIKPFLFRGKVLVLYGARQVGKTTFIKHLQHISDRPTLYLNCDERDVQEQLTDTTSTKLKQLIGPNKLILLDEAQRIVNIGLTLKLMADTLPKTVQVIATGSSVLDLSNKISEPLTGRSIEFRMYPFSMAELGAEAGIIELKRLLKERLIFGMYPEPVLKPGMGTEILQSISAGYLYKDILQYQDIRRPELLDKLLVLLALQAGQLVSYNELANELGIRKETVSAYVHLLERAFVIYRLGPFSRNLRNELKRMRKIYFVDNGIRNVLINNLNALGKRQDNGALWEQFMISERMKLHMNRGNMVNTYFWRNHRQREIDLLEESGGTLRGFELKWRKDKWQAPSAFLNAYPDCTFELVNQDNYMSFVGI